MRNFWLCFVPLFVAVDAIGVLPMFVGLVEGIDRRTKRRVIGQSLVTAALVALGFVAVGTGIMKLLGITVADFMVAGGVLLFVIAMSDLLSSGKPQRQVDVESLGVVPLGVPLITGPAVLTTSILLVNRHGPLPTAAAIVANILIAGAVFWFADHITRSLGNVGAKALSKISSLFLAAIAVMMVRRGIAAFLASGISA